MNGFPRPSKHVRSRADPHRALAAVAASVRIPASTGPMHGVQPMRNHQHQEEDQEQHHGDRHEERTSHAHLVRSDRASSAARKTWKMLCAPGA